MTITFIGHGYVGLVTAAVFADLGNTVWVIGHTPEKIQNLQKGILPIYEPGLEEIVKRNVHAGRLIFTLEYDKAIASSEVIFIAVGTPPLPTGDANLSVVFAVAEEIGLNLKKYAVIVTKSTVPVGTNRKVKEAVEKANNLQVQFDIASCPEFLREGQAIGDTMKPDRIVIGADTEKAKNILLELHAPITGERVVTSVETAEMIKYAANAFLATKISFANSIAQLSEKAGADGIEVLRAIGLDKRIGKQFLSPGAGYGGSCFPKDVKALIAIAESYGYDFTLLKDVEQINKDATSLMLQKIKTHLGGDVKGKTIGILGLSFKPDTDDMRDAPSIIVVKELESLGAKILAYDPVAMDNAKRLMPKIIYTNNAYEVGNQADLVVVMTEWNEFKELDLHTLKTSMKTPILIDGRNIYDPTKMKELGYIYQGVGR